MPKTDIPYYPVHIVKGDSFNLTFRKSTKNCETNELTPIDLTDVSNVDAQVVDLDGVIIQPFSSATVTNPTIGEITISMTSTDTGLLSGIDPQKPSETIGTYYVRITWLDSTVETVLRGKVALTSLEGV